VATSASECNRNDTACASSCLFMHGLPVGCASLAHTSCPDAVPTLGYQCWAKHCVCVAYPVPTRGYMPAHKVCTNARPSEAGYSGWQVWMWCRAIAVMCAKLAAACVLHHSAMHSASVHEQWSIKLKSKTSAQENSISAAQYTEHTYASSNMKDSR
jgi:hypothetical protein